jgi:hypothetical protein
LKKKKKTTTKNSKDPGAHHLEVDEEYEDDPEEKDQMMAFKPKRNYEVPSGPIIPAMVTPNVISDLAEHKLKKPNLTL